MKLTTLIVMMAMFCLGFAVQAQTAGTEAAPTPVATAVQSKEAPDAAAVQQADAKGEEEKNVSKITLKDIMEQGGWLMNVIAGLSLVAIALLFFYLLTMRQAVLYPRGFLMDAQDAADAGDLATLRELCLNNNSSAAKIISVALEQCEDGKAPVYEFLRDAMEDEGGRQASLLWQRLQYLSDVAVLAPMVGLLGTVWGMMISFTGLESGVSMINKADALANGVAQAMYTTFGGLIVGIFAMGMYDLMRGRLNKLIGGMESACGAVLRRLAKKS